MRQEHYSTEEITNRLIEMANLKTFAELKKESVLKVATPTAFFRAVARSFTATREKGAPSDVLIKKIATELAKQGKLKLPEKTSFGGKRKPRGNGTMPQMIPTAFQKTAFKPTGFGKIRTIIRVPK